MMNRRTRATAALLAIPASLLLVTGCKTASTNHSSSINNPAASSQVSDAALPADPADSPADAAPISAQCPTQNTTAFAKTKFVAHTGLAFGALHRYLWSPYKAGTFSKGANGRIMAFVKGGAAALFVKREIRLASEDVKASPALCKAIAAPLAKVGDLVQGAFDKLKHGDASGLTDVNSAVASVESAAKSQGTAITEDANPNLAAVPN
jgi:hypothetical protein